MPTDWPADGRPLDFVDLVASLNEAIEHCYSLRRRNRTSGVAWSGPRDWGGNTDISAGCFTPPEQLTAERLGDDESEGGPTAVERILGLAIQLGIEQGRRMREEIVTRDFELRAAVEEAAADLDVPTDVLDRLSERIVAVYADGGPDMEAADRRLRDRIAAIYPHRREEILDALRSRIGRGGP